MYSFCILIRDLYAKARLSFRQVRPSGSNDITNDLVSLILCLRLEIVSASLSLPFLVPLGSPLPDLSLPSPHQGQEMISSGKREGHFSSLPENHFLYVIGSDWVMCHKVVIVTAQLTGNQPVIAGVYSNREKNFNFNLHT